LVAGLAGRQAQFNQAFLGKQRQAGARLVELAPVEVGFHMEHLAFAEALAAGGGPDGVAGFLAEQLLIAAYGVHRGQRSLQVLAQLGAGQLHGLADSDAARCSACALAVAWASRRSSSAGESTCRRRTSCCSRSRRISSSCCWRSCSEPIRLFWSWATTFWVSRRFSSSGCWRLRIW